MPKTETSKFEFALNHADHGEVRTTVEVAATSSFADHYAEMVHQAQKNVASRFVNYESFSSDSAYSTRLGEVGDEFSVKAFGLFADADAVRWAYLGEHSTDALSPCNDYVMAKTHEEAIFQAKFMMAINESADPDDHEEFEGVMQEITISDCYQEPVTLDEATAYMRTIANLMIPGDEGFGPESDQSDSEALQSLVRQARDMLAGKHVAA